MAVLDSETNEIVIRVVYDGAPEAGKTTSLRALAGSLGQIAVTPEEDGAGRTQWFDWMEYVGGRFEGSRIRCQIVSVPGQRNLATRRRRLLADADVVVSVFDSSPDQVARSLDYVNELRAELRALGEPAIGVILQANKRDVAGAIATEDLRATLGDWTVGIVESIAADGTGIREAFVYAVRLALDRVRELMARGALVDRSPELRSADELLAVLRAADREARAAIAADAAVLAEEIVIGAELDRLDDFDDFGDAEPADLDDPDDRTVIDPFRDEAPTPSFAVADARSEEPRPAPRPSLGGAGFTPDAARSPRPESPGDAGRAPTRSRGDGWRDHAHARGELQVNELRDVERPIPAPLSPASSKTLQLPVLLRPAAATGSPVDRAEESASAYRVSGPKPLAGPSIATVVHSVLAPGGRGYVDEQPPPLPPPPLVPIPAPPASTDRRFAAGTHASAMVNRSGSWDEAEGTPVPRSRRTTSPGIGAENEGASAGSAIAQLDGSVSPAAVLLLEILDAERDGSTRGSPLPTSVPRAPDTHVPSGAIWPPVEGRAILYEVSQLPLEPHRLPDGNWVLGLGTGWRVVSRGDAVFASLDEGRAALVHWARLHATSQPVISPHRCIVLSETGDGGWRLWQIVRAESALRDVVQTALDQDTPELVVLRLCQGGKLLMEAAARVARSPCDLPVTFDTIGVSEGVAVYIGLMPSFAANEARLALTPSQLLRRELGPLVAQVRAANRGAALQHVLGRVPRPALDADPIMSTLVALFA